jgi:hypothetical protein
MFLRVAGGVLHGDHLFVLSNDMQAGLRLAATAVMRNVSKLSQCDWGGEAFPGLGVQSVESLILVGALFLLDGGRRREGKKKEKMKEKKFLWRRRVSLGLDLPCLLCSGSQLLGAIKG